MERGDGLTADDLKRLAGEAAARKIESGQRIGLGTGSTTKFFIEALSGRLRTREIRNVFGVPTSRRTEELARALGIAYPDGTLPMSLRDWYPFFGLGSQDIAGNASEGRL